MKIKKDRYAKIIVSFIATFGILFSAIFLYILCKLYESISNTLLVLAITVACILLIWTICFLLIKFGREYYIIDKDGIRLYKKNQLLFELRQDKILKVTYNGVWGLLIDSPGGYAFFEYAYRAEEDKKFSKVIPIGLAGGYELFECESGDEKDKKSSKVIPHQVKKYEIYMSLKQAKEAAFILDKYLEID